MSYRESKINYDKLRKIAERRGSKIHFIGVGGVSMYSLARVALSYKDRVSGSDAVDSARLDELRALGAEIFVGHSADNIKDVDLVVYTLAIGDDNPELSCAIKRGIPAVTRASFLGALMLAYPSRIGVSGSHGKSTTVAMLDAIFSHAGREPSLLSGADLPVVGEPIKLGRGESLIYEACEYKDSFLRFSPTVAIALNLEYDHTDYFKDIAALRSSFVKALSRASVAIVNYDDEHLNKIIRKIKTRVITFGQGDDSDYKYRVVGFLGGGYDFTLMRGDKHVGAFRLNIPGVFNVSNAVSAIIAAIESGIVPSVIAEGLAKYRGIPRRLEHIGDRFARHVYYDYAHHPTEIRCVINTVRMLHGDSVTVIFAPHTYTRTKSLWDDFISALSLADYVVLLDIYPAREKAISGITSERLAREVGKKAAYVKKEGLISHIDRHTYGTIIVMGAGDMDETKRLVTDT